MNTSDYTIILFYKFVQIPDLEGFLEKHKARCRELGMTGRMLLAEEGINATFEGARASIEAYKEFLKADPITADILVKESAGTGAAFNSLSIKIRDEIVTLGKKNLDIKNKTAKELPAAELEQWYQEGREFVVLDMRNDYEIACGKFDRTIDPGITNFRDLPEKLAQLKEDLKDKTVVSVCTGGIRCEKATCLLTEEGFENVYQLKDGIHTYMQQYPGSHFKGTLFVFDNRMTTDVVDVPNKEIIGVCVFCGTKSENYCSDDSVRPSRKIICCESCFSKESTHLRPSTTA